MTYKLFLLTTIILFVLGVNAQTKKNGAPDMRYKANKETYGNSYSIPSQRTTTQTLPLQTTTARPIYDGQTHTESHGGSYPGSINSHHKDGHYLSPNYNNVYGIHKTKKN